MATQPKIDRDAAPMSASTDPESHIDQIRRRKYLLLPDGAVTGVLETRQDLHGSAQTFARDLYSEKSHFILELIQNAEDNSYPAHVTPHLHFVLQKGNPLGVVDAEGTLLIINNERGFHPSNVEAICGLTVSTKGKKEGYVGEKGLGFKSVFRISRTPYIFSNGYRFHFDENPTPGVGVGYIVPHWVQEIPAELQKYGSSTVIALPLKPGEYAGVQQELQSLAPETILFLSTLNSLTIEIEQQPGLEMGRRPLPRRLVELTVNGQVYGCYWITSRTCNVPEHIHEDRRAGVNSRCVSVALPTSEIGRNLSVFAFLPTKERSCLPFLVNADFLVAASREHVHRDAEWNHWLRNEVAATFVDALTELLRVQKQRSAAYRYIPLQPAEDSDFFGAAEVQIHDALREHAVVWTQDGRMLPPGEVRLAPDAFYDLVGQRSLPRQLHKTPLVHPSIRQYADQLMAIGVRPLTADEIVGCLQDPEWLATKKVGWFANLLRFLQNLEGIALSILKQLTILPSEGKTLVAAADRAVYMRSADRRFEVGELPDFDLVPLVFLHPDLAKLLAEDQPLNAWAVKTFDLRVLSLDAFCSDVVQALARRGRSKPNYLKSWTAFLRERFDRLQDSTKRLVKSRLPIALANGKIRQHEMAQAVAQAEGKSLPPELPLVLPANWDPHAGWQLLFPDEADCSGWDVISDIYLEKCTSPDERQQWGTFFCALGATGTPYPPRIEYRLYTDSARPEGISQFAYDLWKSSFKEYSTDGSHDLTDVLCPKWLKNLMDPADVWSRTTSKRVHALIAWLTRLQSPERVFSGRYEWFHYKWKNKSFESEFGHYLRRAPWFPSTKGHLPPVRVFVENQTVHSIFGSRVAYAKTPLPLNRSLIQCLRLMTDATYDSLMTLLREQASQPADNAPAALLRKIYETLSVLSKADALRADFQNERLILLTKPTPRWAGSQSCLWQDASAVFGDVYGYLEPAYGTLKQFFVAKLGVRERPDDEAYANALSSLADDPGKLPANEVEAALHRIYPVLIKIATAPRQPAWWADFAAHAKVWTQANRFVDSRTVYIPDDGDLQGRFAHAKEQFAWTSRSLAFADLRALYESFGLTLLSEAVRVQIEAVSGAEQSADTRLLNPNVKKAICSVLRSRSREAFAKVRADGRLEALLRTSERAVGALSIRYILSHVEQSATECAAVYWDANAGVLYRSMDAAPEEVEVELPSELGRKLVGGRNSGELEDFIGRVLGATDDVVNAILRKRNYSLSSEEREWVEAVLADAGMDAVTANETSDPAQEEQESRAASNAEEQPATVSPPEHPQSSSNGSPPAARVVLPPSSSDTVTRPGGHVAGWSRQPRGTSGEEDEAPDPRDARSKATTRRDADAATPFRPRRLSYVQPPKARPDEDGEAGNGRHVDEGRAVEQAGIAYVIKYEQGQGRTAVDMNVAHGNHKGYDLESYTTDRFELYSGMEGLRLAPDRIIEVKATSHVWDGFGVGLTPAEFAAAREQGSAYYLYIVERVMSDNPKLYVIQNPAGKVDEYVFDYGWKGAAESMECLVRTGL